MNVKETRLVFCGETFYKWNFLDPIHLRPRLAFCLFQIIPYGISNRSPLSHLYSRCLQV